MSIRRGIVILVSLAGLSCDGPTAPLPLTSPDGRTPIVTGLRVTTVERPEGIDVWGTPNDFDEGNSGPFPGIASRQDIETVIGVIPRGFRLDPLVPNPSTSDVAVQFSIPIETAISVWVVPADLPNNYFAPMIRYPGIAIVELKRNERLSAGSYRILWDGKDAGKRKVYAGLYRIYVQAGSGIAWRDVLIHTPEDRLPQQMYSAFYH